MNLANVTNLDPDEIESVERLTIRWLFQAAIDFGMAAHEIFCQSPDKVKDIAEDVTREMLDSLAGFNVPQRVYGTVDYKKARYIILPDKALHQALFVDSKAEKSDSSATIQMSQTSMHIRQVRAGVSRDIPGALPPISQYQELPYLTTTAFLHFKYDDDENEKHQLEKLTIFCLPNGLLQERYNPDSEDGIWLVGRNAPSLGEDFRARVSFARLREKCSWRVQNVLYDFQNDRCTGVWEE